MQDDFNTPSALSVLFEMARQINTLKKENNSEESSTLAKELVTLSGILGLLQDNPVNHFTQGIAISEKEIEGYILRRNQARDLKDFDLSDKIRDELLEKGIILEDKESGTTWKKS
jgi:cysteinyl-tRNA synthetase